MFDALRELFFLLGKLRFVLFLQGLLQRGNDDCLNGSVTNVTCYLFVHSVFQERGKFKVEQIDLGRVLLGDFDFSLLQLRHTKNTYKIG